MAPVMPDPSLSRVRSHAQIGQLGQPRSEQGRGFHRLGKHRPVAPAKSSWSKCRAQSLTSSPNASNIGENHFFDDPWASKNRPRGSSSVKLRPNFPAIGNLRPIEGLARQTEAPAHASRLPAIRPAEPPPIAKASAILPTKALLDKTASQPHLRSMPDPICPLCDRIYSRGRSAKPSPFDPQIEGRERRANSSHASHLLQGNPRHTQRGRACPTVQYGGCAPQPPPAGQVLCLGAKAPARLFVGNHRRAPKGLSFTQRACRVS